MKTYNWIKLDNYVIKLLYNKYEMKEIKILSHKFKITPIYCFNQIILKVTSYSNVHKCKRKFTIVIDLNDKYTLDFTMRSKWCSFIINTADFEEVDSNLIYYSTDKKRKLLKGMYERIYIK